MELKELQLKKKTSLVDAADFVSTPAMPEAIFCAFCC